MNDLSPHRRQCGYLLEIPLLFIAVVVILSIVLPMLPEWGQKVAIVLAAIPILFALFYMIVIPGWTPDYEGRLKWPWNWVVFILVAIPVVVVVVAFVLA
jgi:hypothetical protein